MNLTDDNYYQDKEYMSKSRLYNYMQCEAKQLAIDNEEWESETTKAMLIGNYIHSYFENQEAHEKFLEQNGDKILTKSGKPYKDFQVADKVIKSLESDEYFLKNYHGESGENKKELIVTGELEGMPFKGKIDTINFTKGYFMDLKTMQSLKDEKYSPKLGYKVPQMIYNIFEYGYPLQMYIYNELLQQQYDMFFTPYIVAVSKQDFPDKELLRIDQEILEIGRKEFSQYINRLKALLSGKIEPNHCGKCDYCRENNKLNHSITISDILSKYAS